jgi:hypothetical protein
MSGTVLQQFSVSLLVALAEMPMTGRLHEAAAADFAHGAEKGAASGEKFLGLSCESLKQQTDWPAFMRQHDMTFGKLPAGWTEAPHFGNAMVGSMLYQDGNTLRLQVFRADVHDHRDDTWGWTAYSRPRLQIGHFSLHPVGKLAGCQWRKDLWNAELTGTITTDRGEIRLRLSHTPWTWRLSPS